MSRELLPSLESQAEAPAIAGDAVEAEIAPLVAWCTGGLRLLYPHPGSLTWTSPPMILWPFHIVTSVRHFSKRIRLAPLVLEALWLGTNTVASLDTRRAPLEQAPGTAWLSRLPVKQSQPYPGDTCEHFLALLDQRDTGNRSMANFPATGSAD